MRGQTTNKPLIIIICILLIANAITLTFLFLNKKHDGLKNNYGTRTTDYLKNEIGFSNVQLDQYEALSNKHRSEKLKPAFDEMSRNREMIYKRLGAASFSDSAINETANAISGGMKDLERIMLIHIKEIRNICTPKQQLIFDTGFYKILPGKKFSKGNDHLKK